MNRPLFRLVVSTAMFLSSCTTVPLTGRQQLDFIPAPMMISLSYQQYGDFLKSNPLSGDQAAARRVKQVGERIQKAVEKYMAAHNLSARIKDYVWEFNLIESDQVNAWCLPGGKVVVYTGILPFTRDDEGLAVVMSHEIAHAIAQHGNERMSQQLLSTLGGKTLDAALHSRPEETKKLWMAAYAAGSQYGVLLPYSRLQESEADHLGLIFMAMAGYDPAAAIAFWERMAAVSQGKAVPELLSDHPSDQNRIQSIKGQLAEARSYYHP